MTVAVRSMHYSVHCHLHFDFTADTSLNGEAERRIKKLISEFQTDLHYAQDNLDGNIERNKDNLVPEEDRVILPPRAQAILNRYAVVDTLAIFYRDQTRKTFIRLLVIAFFAMVVLEVFAHVLPEFFPVGEWPRLAIVLFPGLWLVALALWRRAHRRRFQEKYQDYRALAEGLRVQFFWKLLSLPTRIEDHYLRKQQGELEWIRSALACWRHHDATSIEDLPLTEEQLTAQKDLVRRLWVCHQLEYLAETAGPREKRQSEFWRRRGKELFGASIACAVALCVFELLHVLHVPEKQELGLTFWETALVVPTGLLLAGAAVAIAYGEKMAFAEHTRRYEAASNLFLETRRKISVGPLTLDEVCELRKLGEEALQENGDWLLIHRDRPLEVIIP